MGGGGGVDGRGGGSNRIFIASLSRADMIFIASLSRAERIFAESGPARHAFT